MAEGGKAPMLARQYTEHRTSHDGRCDNLVRGKWKGDRGRKEGQRRVREERGIWGDGKESSGDWAGTRHDAEPGGGP